MKQLAVFVGLLCLSLALIDESIYKQFKDMDENEFGKTLIDTLQIQVSTGEPIEKFVNAMHKLEGQIEAEQKEEDQKNRVFQDSCDTDLNQLESENSLLERRIVEIQSLLDDLQPQVSLRESTQKAKEEWKKNLVKKIAEIDAQREEERSLFQQRMKEHEFAQYVIETVRKLFTNDNLSASFLQSNTKGATPQVIEKVLSHLKQSFEEGQAQLVQKKSYFKLFKILTQITEGMKEIIDPALVNRIVSLCDQLLKNIEQSAVLDRKADQKRELNYQGERTLLMKDLNKLNDELAKLAAEIQTLTDKIVSAQNDMTDANERQAQKQKQVDDRKTDCGQHAFNYQQAREKRNQNRQLVSQIIGLFSANQRDFASYVKMRKQAGDYDYEE